MDSLAQPVEKGRSITEGRGRTPPSEAELIEMENRLRVMEALCSAQRSEDRRRLKRDPHYWHPNWVTALEWVCDDFRRLIEFARESR